MKLVIILLTNSRKVFKYSYVLALALINRKVLGNWPICWWNTGTLCLPSLRSNTMMVIIYELKHIGRWFSCLGLCFQGHSIRQRHLFVGWSLRPSINLSVRLAVCRLSVRSSIEVLCSCLVSIKFPFRSIIFTVTVLCCSPPSFLQNSCNKPLTSGHSFVISGYLFKTFLKASNIWGYHIFTAGDGFLQAGCHVTIWRKCSEAYHNHFTFK